MDVVAYLRRSTGTQDHSFDFQRDHIDQWCQGRGLRLARVFEETASRTAPIEARPVLAEVLAHIRSERPSALVVWRLDRLGGDPINLAMVEAELDRVGGRLEVVDGAGGGTGPTAELIRSVLTAVARYERQVIAARARAQIATRRRAGKALGPAPFGYQAGPQGALQPDPMEQAALQRMRELHGEGAGPTAIARTLSAEGYQPRGKRWWPRTVRSLLVEVAG